VLLRWIGLLPIILLTFSALAQSPLERAVTLAREKRYSAANKLLEGVAEPSDLGPRIAFHRLKAAIASGLGDAKAAAAEMRLALDLAPVDPALSLAAALAYLQAGLLDEALRHARNAGKTAQAEALIGDIQEKRGEFVQAAHAYEDAMALAPDREQYRIALALELVEHQSFTPAIAVLQQAAPLFPRSGKIRTLLGIAQYGEGDLANAVTSLIEAVAADPKLEPAYVYLARIVLESSSAPPEGVLTPLCGWNATVCSALELRVARAKNDTTMQGEAIAGLHHAPSADPIARCELGRAYEWTGQLAEARTEMEECVRLAPSPQNHYRLGIIYRELGLAQLADQEMAIRKRSLDSMSEEVARRAQAIQTFQYVIK
jgi:tetratricopeptide (TPR) repeat protein